ncbi:MAG: anti-sigma F factor [Agathobacter sp.]|nr:anti-sigma F factor [Agathobacter sp.]
MNNEMKLRFKAISENEAFARMTISAFIASLNPTLEEIADVKTAVSEAVTNAIVHGYEEMEGIIELSAVYKEGQLTIRVCDRGVGISNIDEALQPFYTTAADKERSGMGFSFMEAFMDELKVISKPASGTIVIMKKYLKDKSKTDIDTDIDVSQIRNQRADIK